MKGMAAMQKVLEENQAKEAELAANMQNNKKKLLDDLANEEARRDEAVKTLQALKEKEKETLIDSLYSGMCDQKSPLIPLLQFSVSFDVFVRVGTKKASEVRRKKFASIQGKERNLALDPPRSEQICSEAL